MDPEATHRPRRGRRPRETRLPTLRSAREALLGFFFPARCFACSRELGLDQSCGACLACWTGFRILPATCCSGCGIPAPEGTDLVGPARGRCASCILDPPASASVLACVSYDEHARRFLLRAKLGRRSELLAPLGLQLARRVALRLSEIGRLDAVIPLPSHPVRDLVRGFGPAVEIARPVARALGRPLLLGALAHGWGSLIPAKRLSRRLRADAAVGSFSASRRSRGLRVLLVDDVATTGASGDAAARALLRAGAETVHLAVWARTLPPRGAFNP